MSAVQVGAGGDVVDEVVVEVVYAGTVTVVVVVMKSHQYMVLVVYSSSQHFLKQVTCPGQEGEPELTIAVSVTTAAVTPKHEHALEYAK